MKIAGFEFIDTTPGLEQFLSLNPTVPINENFEALGY